MSDIYALGALLILGLITHFILFGFPQALVFDEVYFSKFILAYTHGTYFFDVHPPLGKLSMEVFGRLFGFIPNSSFNPFPFINYPSIGDPIPLSFVYVRLLPLIAGILIPLVVYIFCRQIKISRQASLFAGLALIFENSLEVQSRFMFMDCQLILYGFLALVLYFFAKKLRDTNGYTWRFWLVFFSSAFFATASFSVKWTGLAFTGLICLIEIMDQIRGLYAKKVTQNIALKTKAFVHAIIHSILRTTSLAIVFVAIFASLYIGLLALHLTLLPETGDGDAYMSPEFQSALEGNPLYYDTTFEKPSLMSRVSELNYSLYYYQSTLTKDHPYSSKWYTWPFMLRPIFYWDGQDSKMIYLLGNPVVYWLSSFAMAILTLLVVYQCFLSLTHRRPAPEGFYTMLIITCAYYMNFLPFSLITRPMFLYHYFTALIFAVIAWAVLIDHFMKVQKDKVILICILSVLIVIFYIYFSPLTYGYAPSHAAVMRLFWFKGWR